MNSLMTFLKVTHNDATLESYVKNQRYVDSLYNTPTDSLSFNY